VHNAQVLYQQDVFADAELVNRILSALPPMPQPVVRVFRCSRENVDGAIARAISHAAQLQPLTRLEIVKGSNVT